MPIKVQFRFSAAIVDLRLNGTVYKIGDTTINPHPDKQNYNLIRTRECLDRLHCYLRNHMEYFDK